MFNSLGLFLLRVSFGLGMLWHGWGKIDAYKKLEGVFPDPLEIGSKFSLMSAIGAEAGCSLLLILGLATRIVALPLAFTMGVAIFMVHDSDPWKVKELAAAYLAVYVVLIFTGGGKISLDHLIWGKKDELAS